ncbi:MAG: hypothetical protein ACPGXZ_06600 [Saprospiraceae bacterium]
MTIRQLIKTKGQRRRTDLIGHYQLNKDCSPVIIDHLKTLKHISKSVYSKCLDKFYIFKCNRENRVTEKNTKHVWVLLENELILVNEETNRLVLTDTGLEMLAWYNKEKVLKSGKRRRQIPNQSSLT